MTSSTKQTDDQGADITRDGIDFNIDSVDTREVVAKVNRQDIKSVVMIRVLEYTEHSVKLRKASVSVLSCHPAKNAETIQLQPTAPALLERGIRNAVVVFAGAHRYVKLVATKLCTAQQLVEWPAAERPCEKGAFAPTP